MSATTNLGLSYLAPGQAQKHVTVNQSLARLDALVQARVVSATTAAEPSSPADGALYILPIGKTGAHWGAMADGALAYFHDGAWEEVAPQEGWRVHALDTGESLRLSGGGWGLVRAGLGVSVSATDKLLGRRTTGAGAAEEITCTAAGRALIDDADASAQRTTLGLGTAATQDTGSSGTHIPLLNIANTWSARQDLSIAADGYGLRAFWPSSQYVTLGRFSGVSYLNASGSSLVISADDVGSAAELVAGGGLDRLKVDGSAHALTFNGKAVFHGGASAVPAADNSANLGSASFRFATVFAATGTINTSDAREKTPLAPISPGAKRAIRRILAGVGVFQWLSSRAEKGADAARLHVGVTAQAVRDAFLAEGEDPERWAFFCRDAMEGEGEDGERLGLRSDQLLWLALAVMAG